MRQRVGGLADAPLVQLVLGQQRLREAWRPCVGGAVVLANTCVDGNRRGGLRNRRQRHRRGSSNAFTELFELVCSHTSGCNFVFDAAEARRLVGLVLDAVNLW